MRPGQNIYIYIYIYITRRFLIQQSYRETKKTSDLSGHVIIDWVIYISLKLGSCYY